MDRGAWPAVVRGVTKSWTRLSDFTSLTIMDLKLIWIALPYFNFSNKNRLFILLGEGDKEKGKEREKGEQPKHLPLLAIPCKG